MVGEDELFGVCFALDCEYEFVSLRIVLVAKEQEMVCALRDVRAVRAGGDAALLIRWR